MLPTRFSILCGTLSVLCACSNFNIRSQEKKEFSIHKVWIHSTTQKDNLAFRKINRHKPLFFDDMVISANAIDGVVAVNRDSGSEVWRLPITNGVESAGTLINDRLFFGANDGQFYSVNAKTGKVLWTFPTRVENLSEPLLEEGILYFLTGSNNLYALDATTGKQLWLYSRQDPSSLSIRGGSKPAYRNGTLYVGFSDGALVALLAKNGAIKWEKQLNKNKKFRDIDSNPIVVDDDIFVLGYDDAIYCLRAANGDQVWRSDRGGYGTPLAIGNSIYYATSTNEFAALNKGTGQKIWSYSLKDGVATSPISYKGLIVFGESQGSLVFLEPSTGKYIGGFEPGMGIFSPPNVDEKNSRIYFISNEANLYSMEAKWETPSKFKYLQQ